MKCNFKKILFCFSALVFLFFAAGCEKETEKTTPILTTSQYTLTYTAEENGFIEGTSLQTVNAGSDGSPVTAVPAKNYHFVGWSDGLATPSRVDLNVTANLTVTAKFAIDQYSLNYIAGKNGTIVGVSQQTVDHGGTGSKIKAEPNVGYHFVSWNDGVSTASRSDSNVASDLTVTANFSLNQYTLIYSAGKGGILDGVNLQTIDHGGDGSLITAIPAEHHYFAGWSDGVATATRSDQNITADLTVKANFAIEQYTLTYLAGENGSIKGVSTQTVDHGGTGSRVTAVPTDGYHFESWSDGLAVAGRIDSDVTADLSVRAGFAINRYTLTYEAEENGSIDGVSLQTVDHGSAGTPVTAVADKGFHFVSWSDGVPTAQRIDSNVINELTVSALFEINTYTVGGNVAGLVDGTQLVLQNNGGDDLEITTNGDFNFALELLDASTYEVSVLSQPTSPNQICAVSGGTGKISGENVKDIMVTCVLVTYTIGGTISGLPAGDQVVLRNNEGDDLVVSVNGGFTFATPLDDGSDYEVTIYSLPVRPNWTCDLENGAGALTGMNVTDVIVDCYPKVVLQATAGIRKMKLQWNSYDFSDVTFNLCIAQEDISFGGFSTCQDLIGSTLETKVNSPVIVSQLTNDIPYWFQLEAQYDSGRQTLSEVVKGIPFGGLNDSGIDWCTDDNTNNDTDGTRSEKTKGCESLAETHPGQDAFHGRDASALTFKLVKGGIGSAGFDFTKLCTSGKAAGEADCPPNPSLGKGLKNWACTRDNVTGLVWEIKMESGLRSHSNTYTWYNPDETMNGGKSGLKNGGKCEGSDCDTRAYIEAINEIALCGSTEWRLPTKRELLSIVNNGSFKPAVDIRLFPNTLSSQYWTSSPYPEDPNLAWQVYFLYGEALPSYKNQNNHIRLVHGRTVTFGFDNP